MAKKWWCYYWKYIGEHIYWEHWEHFENFLGTYWELDGNNKIPNNPTTICLPHPTLKRKDIFKDKETCTSFSFLPLTCSFARLLLRSLAPSLTKSPSPSHSFAVRSFYLQALWVLSGLSWLKYSNLLFPFFFFFFDFFGCAGTSLKVWWCQERLDRVWGRVSLFRELWLGGMAWRWWQLWEGWRRRRWEC